MKRLISGFFLLLSAGTYAQDTFSICAVDTVTGEVGSAGASCIDALQIGNTTGCALISDVHPGVGVVHTQAYYITPNQAYAQSLMNMGLSPQQIMDSMQVNDAQSNPAIRQYGAVKLVGIFAGCCIHREQLHGICRSSRRCQLRDPGKYSSWRADP